MLAIRPLAASDVQPIADAFARLGWNKPASQYERYLEEALKDIRTTLVATSHGQFAGYLTIKWQSGYPPFRDANIPELQDFNVLPEFRRRGIGARLMDETEVLVSARSTTVGLGVAFDPDYGSAQRLYVKRGYVPDGLGAMWNGARVKWGDSVRVDDDLVFYLTKSLHRA
jgi:GNAT superfamily N-acetyltransferase